MTKRCFSDITFANEISKKKSCKEDYTNNKNYQLYTIKGVERDIKEKVCISFDNVILIK